MTSCKIDHAQLLNCIAAVESNYNDGKIGDHGERSCYQLKEITWRQWQDNVDFKLCYGPRAHLAAANHLLWLSNNIPTTGNYQADILYLYEAWAIGLNAYRRGKINFDVVSRANRVLNLYLDQQRNRASPKLLSKN